MIGLDTSILVRFLTQDDVRQSSIANRVIQRDLTEQTPGFISIVTVAETVWVLEARYGVTRVEAADAIEGLISQDAIVVEDYEEVVRAIERVRGTNADFSDSLIAGLGQKAGCDFTLTFDRKASRLPGFQTAK